MGFDAKRPIEAIELADRAADRLQVALHILALDHMTGVHVMDGLIEIVAHSSHLPRERDDLGARLAREGRAQKGGRPRQAPQGFARRHLQGLAKFAEERVFLLGHTHAARHGLATGTRLSVRHVLSSAARVRFGFKPNCRTY